MSSKAHNYIFFVTLAPSEKIKTFLKRNDFEKHPHTKNTYKSRFGNFFAHKCPGRLWLFLSMTDLNLPFTHMQRTVTFTDIREAAEKGKKKYGFSEISKIGPLC